MHKRPGTRNTSSAAVLTPRTKTCLSICKHSGIVALETAFDQLLCAGTVDGLLLRVHVKHKVIGEGLVFPQDHLRLSRHHIRTDVTSLNLLPGQLRTNPAENPETVIRLCQVSLFLCTIVLKVLYDSGKMLLSVNTKRKKKAIRNVKGMHYIVTQILTLIGKDSFSTMSHLGCRSL